MHLTQAKKEDIKRELVACLCTEAEITKIVVFGSFLTSNDPHDLDVAVFQNGNEDYLPLAMRYRKKTRVISRHIAVDILPIKADVRGGAMLDSIAQGDVIYER